MGVSKCAPYEICEKLGHVIIWNMGRAAFMETIKVVHVSIQNLTSFISVFNGNGSLNFNASIGFSELKRHLNN